MTNQEINHEIATKINGWIHDDGIFYHDADGNTCYLADYCNSVPHALDLAKPREVGLAPTPTSWTAYSIADSEVFAEDELPGKAICLCLLKIASTVTA
jgi:hypothetical protein